MDDNPRKNSWSKHRAGPCPATFVAVPKFVSIPIGIGINMHTPKCKYKYKYKYKHKPTDDNNDTRRKVNGWDKMPLTRDIWVGNILPFVGMGHYAFLASVNRTMKDLYLFYCATVTNPPEVRTWYHCRRSADTEPAIPSHTFQSAVFSSVACAEYCDRFYNISWYRAMDSTVSTILARTGNLQVLTWAHQRGVPWCSQTLEVAAQYGHVPILHYALSTRCPWNERRLCFTAAQYGQLEFLKHAHEINIGCSLDEDVCFVAAQYGQLEVLKYLHENGCPLHQRLCFAAASFGQLELLKYLHENKCLWSKLTCSAAARKGHLDVVKYLHENGCMWDEETCTYAAAGGHLEVLAYAHENGCPWDAETLHMAKGDTVIQYLCDHGLF